MPQPNLPPKTPSYHTFPPMAKGGVTIGIERFSDMLAQIAPLHFEHFRETEAVYLNDRFNPNYALLMEMEKDGRFVCFTMRLGWQMVAYLQYYVFHDVHSKDVLNAREDAFFIHPSVRGQKLAPMLLTYAEDALKTLGCRYVGMTSKAPVGAPDIGPFLERRNYRAVATYYVKQLEV